jgi:hypothetical protein
MIACSFRKMVFDGVLQDEKEEGNREHNIPHSIMRHHFNGSNDSVSGGSIMYDTRQFAYPSITSLRG